MRPSAAGFVPLYRSRSRPTLGRVRVCFDLSHRRPTLHPACCRLWVYILACVCGLGESLQSRSVDQSANSAKFATSVCRPESSLVVAHEFAEFNGTILQTCMQTGADWSTESADSSSPETVLTYGRLIILYSRRASRARGEGGPRVPAPSCARVIQYPLSSHKQAIVGYRRTPCRALFWDERVTVPALVCGFPEKPASCLPKHPQH